MARNEQASPAEIQKYLGGIDYPAPKEQLVQQAREQNAPEGVRTVLDGLPNKQYDGPDEVSEEVGRIQ